MNELVKISRPIAVGGGGGTFFQHTFFLGGWGRGFFLIRYFCEFFFFVKVTLHVLYLTVVGVQQQHKREGGRGAKFSNSSWGGGGAIFSCVFSRRGVFFQPIDFADHPPPGHK